MNLREYKLRDFTRIYITSPDYPTRAEAEKVVIDSAFDKTTVNTPDAVDRLFEERNKLNRTLLTELHTFLYQKTGRNSIDNKPVISDEHFAEIELPLKISSDIAISELRKFYVQSGGERHLPSLMSESEGLHFRLKEAEKGENADTLIMFTLTRNNLCNMTIANDSHYWGMRFGIKGRSEFGNMYLGGDTSPKAQKFCSDLISHFREMGYMDEVAQSTARVMNRGGHPGLDHDEIIYRLAKAQVAEEIRSTNPEKRWKEIAVDIEWNKGSSKAGVKLLEDARIRLVRLEKSDPKGLLNQVSEYRAKETKKT